jgi:hypothetical protein
MRRSRQPCTPSQLSQSTQQHLRLYALGVSATGVSLLALPPSSCHTRDCLHARSRGADIWPIAD